MEYISHGQSQHIIAETLLNKAIGYEKHPLRIIKSTKRVCFSDDFTHMGYTSIVKQTRPISKIEPSPTKQEKESQNYEMKLVDKYHCKWNPSVDSSQRLSGRR